MKNYTQKIGGFNYVSARNLKSVRTESDNKKVIKAILFVLTGLTILAFTLSSLGIANLN